MMEWKRKKGLGRCEPDGQTPECTSPNLALESLQHVISKVMAVLCTEVKLVPFTEGALQRYIDDLGTTTRS